MNIFAGIASGKDALFVTFIIGILKIKFLRLELDENKY